MVDISKAFCTSKRSKRYCLFSSEKVPIYLKTNHCTPLISDQRQQIKGKLDLLVPETISKVEMVLPAARSV